MTDDDAKWFRLNEAVNRYDQVTDYIYGPPSLRQSWDHQAERDLRLSRAGLSGAVRLEGCKVSNPEHEARGELEPVPAEYFRVTRTFEGERQRISSWSDAQSFEDFLAARNNGERHPNWIDVVVERERFEAWIAREIRDWLIDYLRYGRVTLDRAKEIAAKEKCKPLELEPDTAQFDPMQEAQWSLLMTLAWMVWRTPEAVRNNWKDYTDQCSYLSGPQNWRDVGDDLVHNGYLYYTPSSPSILGLLVAESYPENLKQNALQMSVNQARKSLWQALSEGTIIATGIDESTDTRRPISAHEWQDLELGTENFGEALIFSHGEKMTTLAFRRPSIPRGEVLKQEHWPSLAMTPVSVGTAGEASPSSSAATVKKLGIPPIKKAGKYPGDENIVIAVLEDLTDTGADEMGIEARIKDCAANLGKLPSDTEDQIRLVDRIRRRVQKQRRAG